jgi:TRAP-type C4-dicarboxylate transport system substrate-binding protein
MQKHMNAAAKRQRDDIVKANADLRKSLESKGLAFNTVDPAPFQATLKSSGFYKQAQQQFGPEAWGLLTKYTGPIG